MLWEERKDKGIQHLLFSRGVLLTFYLAVTNSAFREYQLSHVMSKNMIYLFIDQG